MKLKKFWSKTSNWFGQKKYSDVSDYQPNLDENGLIDEQHQQSGDEKQDHVVIQPVKPVNKNGALDKLNRGFEELVGQLSDINKNLDRQITQNEDIMNRMEKLPDLLESFPPAVQNQKQLTEQLLEQLKTNVTKNQQFTETIERIPLETAKQTDALNKIDHQLAAAADTDVQMAESFNKFNYLLDRINQNTVSHSDSILQMSKTFAASDRYLKYLMNKQSKRFAWLFILSITVSVLVIAAMAGIIVYLAR